MKMLSKRLSNPKHKAYYDRAMKKRRDKEFLKSIRQIVSNIILNRYSNYLRLTGPIEVGVDIREKGLSVRVR